MSSFEFEGHRYTGLAGASHLTLDELDEVLGWLEGQGLEPALLTLHQPRHRPKLMKVLFWASVRRERPDFTLAEAGVVEVGIAGDALARPPAPAPVEPDDPDVVLSPTKPASAPKRGRVAAAASSGGRAKSGNRSLRTSTTSTHPASGA